MRRPLLGALCAALLGALLATTTHAEDVPGSKDHPFLGRIPYAWIVHYSQEESARYRLVLSALPSDDAGPEDAERSRVLEGRVTRIQYSLEAMRTAATVYFQYAHIVQRGKLDTLLERKGPPTRAPGGSVWLKKVFAPLGEDAVRALTVSTAPGQRRFYAGRQVRDDGEVYLVMVVNQHTDTEVRIQMDIIEL